MNAIAYGGTRLAQWTRETVIRHLSPAALAAISVELEAAERSSAEDQFLDDVNAALDANVGPDDAEQHRELYRNHDGRVR